MIKLLQKLFKRKQPLPCGGMGCISVCDNLGREVAEIWFTRPDSDMRIDFEFQVRNNLISDNKLRKISAQKSENQTKTMYNTVVKDFFLPFAEKIFVRCTGYVDEGGVPIARLHKQEQFGYLKKWHSHNLIDMVEIAFQNKSVIKKKI